MALTRYAKQPSRTYSGGNKRKLSAAIALIGNPSVIFMVSLNSCSNEFQDFSNFYYTFKEYILAGIKFQQCCQNLANQFILRNREIKFLQLFLVYEEIFTIP